jgi:hypothetical protein
MVDVGTEAFTTVLCTDFIMAFIFVTLSLIYFFMPFFFFFQTAGQIFKATSGKTWFW